VSGRCHGAAWSSGSQWSSGAGGWSQRPAQAPGFPGLAGFAADLAGWNRSSRLRVGDAEREAAVAALGEHFAAGRLTPEELDERSSAAWAARTGGDLSVLFADLPQPHAGGTQPRPVTRRPRPARFPLVPALALALGVALLTPVPFLVVLLVTWLTFVSVVRPVVDARQTKGSQRAVRGTGS
jgi:hypothetical protein